MQVSDHVPGYKGKTVGVARQSDVFIFHSPIGNFVMLSILHAVSLVEVTL